MADEPRITTGVYDSREAHAARLCEMYGITVGKITASMPDAKHKDMDGWRVQLTYKDEEGRHSMTTPFFTGSGWRTRVITAADVMECLLLDAESVRYESDMAWGEEMGYDMDDPKERRTALTAYRACERAAKRLKEFLGEEVYEHFAMC